MPNKIDKNLQLLEDKIKSIDSADARDLIKSAAEVIEPEKIHQQIDFLQLKSDVNEQSEKTVKSIAELFFDFDSMKPEVEKMVKSRMELDVISLHSIVYQIRTSDYAIAQILDELNAGFTAKSAKLYELLNQMQKTNIDSIKTLSSLTTILENQYNNLKKSIDEVMVTKSTSDDEDEDGSIKRGTRDILKDISDVDEEIKRLNVDDK